MKERVQKLMAQANVGSRRANEDLIRQGRVRVNGQVAKLGDQADPEKDVIEVDGLRLKLAGQRKLYIALYKPLNVLTTSVHRRDDERKTVYDLVPVDGHLFTIGRLDADSEGLLILTNDGELTNKLTHPRYKHTKTYRATVYGEPDEETIARWEGGVYLEEGKTAPCSVRVLKSERGMTTLEIVMTEGKKRQIRRVASMVGHPVKSLVRTHIGKLGLGELRPGEWRELGATDLVLMQTPAVKIGWEKQRRIRRADSDTPSFEGRKRPRPKRGRDETATKHDRTGGPGRGRTGAGRGSRPDNRGRARAPQPKNTRRRDS